MTNYLISIIVPCYNHAQYLDECLESVLGQIYTNWECIIVDDGSPDKTEEISQSWINKDSRFQYLYKKNGGLSSARNAGIKVSNGGFILPLDADDILHPDCLKKMMLILKNNHSISIVSCYTKCFKGNKTNIVSELKPLGSNYRDLMFENKLIASSLFRKECWEEVGGYDENMNKGFEDWEFWLNITKRQRTFYFVEEFLFYYRKSKKSMLVDALNNHAETNMEYIFRKHQDIYCKHFDNTAEVLFYYIKIHRMGKMQIKKSIEYKIGKLFTKPFRMISKLLASENKSK